jgi:hypothetical protein
MPAWYRGRQPDPPTYPRRRRFAAWSGWRIAHYRFGKCRTTRCPPRMLVSRRNKRFGRPRRCRQCCIVVAFRRCNGESRVRRSDTPLPRMLACCPRTALHPPRSQIRCKAEVDPYSSSVSLRGCTPRRSRPSTRSCYRCTACQPRCPAPSTARACWSRRACIERRRVYTRRRTRPRCRCHRRQRHRRTHRLGTLALCRGRRIALRRSCRCRRTPHPGTGFRRA